MNAQPSGSVVERESAAEASSAWLPLTPAGIARFSRAGSGRLLLVQLVVALGVACAVVWFLRTAWYPVVAEAIRQLPNTGSIHVGTLDWSGSPQRSLAENPFLAVVVDVSHQGSIRLPADIQLEFGTHAVKVSSLAGYAEIDYPRDRDLPASRPYLEPWWGAWDVPLSGIAFLGVVAFLMVTWMTLAMLYAVPAWLVAFFANRELTLAGGWRLAGAALMPGALFMTIALLCYGVGVFDLVRFLAAAILHVLLGWGFVFAAALAAPRQSATAAHNPFKPVVSSPASRPPDGPPNSPPAPNPETAPER